MFKTSVLAIAAAASTVAAPAIATAATPRDMLADAVLTARDKPSALASIARADAAAASVLARKPGDRDAMMTRAMALGYRGKLNKSRKDVLASKAQFEAMVARNPRDAEALAALGSWHLGAVADLGGLMARAGLGARKAAGITALDRSIALGGDRSLFLALAAFLRLGLDPKDARGTALAEAAARGSTPTPLDRIMQRRAAEMLGALRGANPKSIQALAKRLLPLGQIAS